MWGLDNVVMQWLAAIGMFTTTFSIIEPRPLLAISHQAHAIVDPIWYSFKASTAIPLGLAGGDNFTLHTIDNLGFFDPLCMNATCTYTTLTSSSKPASSTSINATTELTPVSVEDGKNATVPPAAKISYKPPVDYQKVVAARLLHTWDWICLHQVILLIAVYLSALSLALFVPITVPTSAPGTSRVKITRRAAKGPCGYQWSLFSTLTDSHSEKLPMSKPLDISAQSLDKVSHGSYVKRSRFNRKQRALKQSQTALEGKTNQLATTEWSLNVQTLIAHFRNIAMENNLQAAKQAVAIAQAEIVQKDNTIEAIKWDLDSQKFISRARNIDAEEKRTKEVHNSAVLRAENIRLQNRLDASETANVGLQSTITTLRAGEKAQCRIASEAGRQAKEFLGTIKALQRQIAIKEAYASELETRVEHLTDDFSDCEERLASEMEESSKNKALTMALAGRAQGLEQDLMEVNGELIKTTAQLEAANAQVIDGQRREENLEKDSTAANALVTQLDGAVEAGQVKLHESKDKEQALQKANDALETTLSDLEADNKTQKREAEDWNSACKILYAEKEVLHGEKDELEKQIATSTSQKTEVDRQLEDALTEARGAKQMLYLVNQEKDGLRAELRSEAQNAAIVQRGLRHEISIWIARRDGFALQVEDLLRQRKDDQDELVDLRKTVIRLQVPRAVAFTNLKMMPKRRSSDETTAVDSSEGSPQTSPSTNLEGGQSDRMQILNASAIEFTPRGDQHSTPSQGQVTLAQAARPPRPGNAVRQQRRKQKVNKDVQDLMAEWEALQAQPMKSAPAPSQDQLASLQAVQVTKMTMAPPAAPAPLPSGVQFRTPGSKFNMTIWRLDNGSALVAMQLIAQPSPKISEGSCALFDYDEAHFEARTPLTQVLHFCGQSAKLFCKFGRLICTERILRAKKTLDPPLTAEPEKALFPDISSSTPKKSHQPDSNEAPKAAGPAAESKPVTKPVASMWAQAACADDPHCSDADCTLRHPKRVKRARIPCGYFEKGDCRKGAACDYKHDLVNQQAPASTPAARDAGSAASPSAPPTATELQVKITEAQVDKRADEIVKRPGKWNYTSTQAKMEARDELKEEAASARAKAKGQAERLAKKAVEVAAARVEEEYQSRLAMYWIELNARVEVILKKGPWDMSRTEAEGDAKKELGKAPSR